MITSNQENRTCLPPNAYSSHSRSPASPGISVGVIRFSCPNCNRELGVPEKVIGKVAYAVCPQCAESVNIRPLAETYPSPSVRIIPEPPQIRNSPPPSPAVELPGTQVAAHSLLEKSTMFYTSIAALSALILVLVGTMVVLLKKQNVPQPPPTSTQIPVEPSGDTQVMGILKSDANELQQSLSDLSKECQKLEFEIERLQHEKRSTQSEIETLRKSVL